MEEHLKRKPAGSALTGGHPSRAGSVSWPPCRRVSTDRHYDASLGLRLLKLDVFAIISRLWRHNRSPWRCPIQIASIKASWPAFGEKAPLRSTSISLNWVSQVIRLTSLQRP